jgi:SSS family solute:Na+ symporter
MRTVTAGGAQIFVCVAILLVIACATWWKVRGARGRAGGTDREMFLAGKGLTWPFVAGAITLTNLSTDQLVGMNGNQMLLLAWWEIAGFAGLLILAFVFVPIYYRYNCTTVTELLERRYTGDGRGIRQLVSGLFLFGNILIYLPAALYSGALFMRSLWGTDAPLLAFAAALAVASAAYTILGGLRAVAVMDTYSGVGVLALALLIVVLALAAIDFDLSGVPPERLTMIGAADSPIPFHTLFTGMILIQIFYWSTNQNITQKAMAAPTVREAQKGVLVAAGIRLLVVPPIVVVPGVVAYQLFGDIGDAAYGRLVGEVLPGWLAGAFAAMVAAAVITTFSAVLNSSVALYKVDFHDRLFPGSDHRNLNRWVSALLTVIAIALVPLYGNAESIINLLQQLNGLLSMPILSAFVAGLLFRGVDARAAIAGVVSGVALYGGYTFALQPAGIVRLHYIDFMVLTLLASVLVALATNLVLGGRARLAGWSSHADVSSKA